MKKALVWAVIAAFALNVVAGCTSSAEETEPPKLPEGRTTANKDQAPSNDNANGETTATPQ